MQILMQMQICRCRYWCWCRCRWYKSGHTEATATRLLESIADMCIFTDMMQMQDIDSDAETDTTEYAFAYIHSDADANANINTERNANTSLLDWDELSSMRLYRLLMRRWKPCRWECYPLTMHPCRCIMRTLNQASTCARREDCLLATSSRESRSSGGSVSELSVGGDLQGCKLQLVTG